MLVAARSGVLGATASGGLEHESEAQGCHLCRIVSARTHARCGICLTPSRAPRYAESGEFVPKRVPKTEMSREACWHRLCLCVLGGGLELSALCRTHAGDSAGVEGVVPVLVAEVRAFLCVERQGECAYVYV